MATVASAYVTQMDPRLQEHGPHLRRYLQGAHLWTPSHFAGSCGGAPLAVVKEYIQDQRRPGP